MKTVRDYREKPFAWQEKAALRKMRDYRGPNKEFSKNELVKMRNLYLALTEIASDNSEESFRPKGGDKTIQTYSGLTKKAIRKARKQLIQLGLIKVIELWKNGGGKVGYQYILKPCRREENLKSPKIQKKTINPKKSSPEREESKECDSLDNDSLDNDSGGSFRSSKGIRSKGVRNKYVSDIQKIKDTWQKIASKKGSGLINHKEPTLNNYDSKIRTRLKEGRSVKQLIQAIKGLDKAFRLDKSWWSRKKGLDALMQRGQGAWIDKFSKAQQGKWRQTDLLKDDINTESEKVYENLVN